MALHLGKASVRLTLQGLARPREAWQDEETVRHAPPRPPRAVSRLPLSPTTPLWTRDGRSTHTRPRACAALITRPLPTTSPPFSVGLGSSSGRTLPPVHLGRSESGVKGETYIFRKIKSMRTTLTPDSWP